VREIITDLIIDLIGGFVLAMLAIGLWALIEALFLTFGPMQTLLALTGVFAVVFYFAIDVQFMEKR